MIPTSVRIFVCTEPQDMRRSFDRLSYEVKERLGEEPQSGSLFVFSNKSATRLKVLWWDRNGYCILYKRLHGARFALPTAGTKEVIDARTLAAILSGVEKSRGGSATS